MQRNYFSRLSENEELMESSQVGKDIYRIKSYWGDFLYAPFKDYVVETSLYSSRLKLSVLKTLRDSRSWVQPFKKPCSVTFDMSHGCQLRCKYCSVDNDGDNSKKISAETVKFCIDSIVANAKEVGSRKVAALFLGKGEPTTNWQVLEFALEYLKKSAVDNGLDYHRCVTTNGVLSEKCVDYLAKNSDGLILSWDGTQEIQDLNRPLRNGSGSFGFVTATAKRLNVLNRKFQIRPTVTRAAANEIENITNLFVSHRPEQILLQPLYSVGRGDALEPPTAHEFCDAYFTALQLAVPRGVRVEYPGNCGLMTQFCSAYNGLGFSVSADGNVSSCDCIYSETDDWGKEFIYGRIADAGLEIYEKRLDALRRIIPENISGCSDCFAFHCCKGHCLNNHLGSGTSFLPLSARTNIGCRINRLIFLFKLIYHAKGSLPNVDSAELAALNVWR